MMKRILLTISSLLISNLIFGTADTVFYEPFDVAPYDVTTYNTLSSSNAAFNDTNALWVSPPNSYHSRVSFSDTVYFETNTFSTIGNTFVLLRFNHIAKFASTHRGYISVSTDNGATWTRLTNTHYRSQSAFSSLQFFMQQSYNDPSKTPYWGGVQTSANQPGHQPSNQWWATELFDISSIAGTGPNGTDSGFAQVKVRFELQFRVQAFPFQGAGWFIDDLLVTAAPCELLPPSIDWSVGGSNRPEGARYAATQLVRFNASDIGDGLKDSAVIHYRMNGGPWMNSIMTKSNTANCPSNSNFEYAITGLVVGDTVDYHIEVFDCACPNKTIAPPTTVTADFYRFYIEPSPPLKCGPTLAGPPPVIPFRVESLPWSESFELPRWQTGSGGGQTGNAHRGNFATGAPPNGRNWVVVPAANQTGYAWSVRENASPLTNTGPNAARSGSQYLYTESQQTSLSNTTELITPCISLSNFGCTALEFYYHMYGNHIGTLHIDVDTGTTGPSWVNSVYSISGQQHSSANQNWSRAIVGLTPYSDKNYVRIRFRAVRGQGHLGHISIDDVRLFEPPTGVDIELRSRSKPISGKCSYGSQEDVEITLRLNSCSAINQIPIAYSYYNSSLGTPVTIVERDTIVGNFILGDELTYTFTPKANLLPYGLYRMKIWSEYPNDIDLSNDTIAEFNLRHDQPFTSFPITFNLDSAGYIPGDYGVLPGTFPSSFTDFWNIAPDNTATNYSWRLARSFTPTPLTGPLADFSNFGNYLYTEGNHGNAGANAVLFSNCMDLTGMTNPSLDLFYHMYGADIGGLLVQVLQPGTSDWINIPGGVLFLSGNPNAGQNIETADWKFWRVDLNQFSNQIIRVRIIGNKASGGSASDIAIDNITIHDRIASDAGIVKVQPPGLPVPIFNTNPVPGVTIINYGTSNLTSIPVSLTITSSCGTVPPITISHTFTGNILPGQQQNFSFPPAMAPSYPEGEFTICATTNVTGDVNTFNNEWCKKTTAWATRSIPFDSNFDICNFDDNGFSATGRLRIFEIGNGATSQFSSADSPPNIWASGLNRNYIGHASYEEFLNFPRFVDFDTVWGAELILKHRWNLGTTSGVQFQYLTSNGWQTLGIPDVGLNVYPTSEQWASANVASLQGPGYVGSRTQWTQTILPLNFYNENTSPLFIRVRLAPGTSGGAGWAMDNFRLHVPPQNSASPIDLNSEGPLPIFLPDFDNVVRFRVQNTGAKRLRTYKIHYRVYDSDGNLVFGPTAKDSVVLNPSIFRNTSRNHTHSVNWSNPVPGRYTVCAITSRPNNKQDNLPADDSICFNVTVWDEIDLEQGQFCDDFEIPDFSTWVSFNYANKNGITNFEVDTPNQAPFLVPLPGSPTAWVLGPDFDYKSRDSSAIYSPMFLVNKDSAYDMSFMHTFKTELYHDGMRLDVSYDAGYTWKPVGDFDLTKIKPDLNWYNTEYVTALDYYNPGWSGDSEGWIKSRIRFSVDTTAGAIFRFRFAADQTVEMEGWAMDSFCIGKTHIDSVDHIINVEELEKDEFIATNLFPNPTNDMTYLPINMPNNSKISIVVSNMIGQRIHIREESLDRGKNMLEFDVKNWAAGMYTITLESDGHVITKKLVVIQQ